MQSHNDELLKEIFGDDEDLIPQGKGMTLEALKTAVRDDFDSVSLKELSAQFEEDIADLQEDDVSDDQSAHSDFSDVYDSEDDRKAKKLSQQEKRLEKKEKRKNANVNPRMSKKQRSTKKASQIGSEKGSLASDDEASSQISEEDEENDDGTDGKPRNRARAHANSFPEFDELLEPMKHARSTSRRRARRLEEDEEDLGDEEAIDEKAATLISRMRSAAELDMELNRKQMPAVNKLKMLSEVTEQLTRRDLHLYFLDNGILDAIRLWLEPLLDGALPGFDIRRQMLQSLEILPIDRDHLKESGVGKVIMFLFKNPKETDDNRRRCETLISKWSRPIFGLQAQYAGEPLRKEAEARVDDDARASEVQKNNANLVTESRRFSSGQDGLTDKEQSLSKRPGEAGFSWHARIPAPAAFDYVIKPKSKINVEAQHGENRSSKLFGMDTYRKLNQKMRLQKK